MFFYKSKLPATFFLTRKWLHLCRSTHRLFTGNLGVFTAGRGNLYRLPFAFKKAKYDKRQIDAFLGHGAAIGNDLRGGRE
jgi:hypothetical protein